MNEKILMGGADLPLVWTEENLRAVGLSGKTVTKEEILASPAQYRDTRYLFSTWGMPRFEEQEIRNCLPSLRAVFYAAGSVQSFAAPFLDAGVAVFSARAANAVPVAEYTVAQILLTADDLACADRHKKFEDTMERLLELNVLPIINENDTVATDEVGVENTIGENDTLSAIVAAAVQADLLILLSDIDGLYDGDPHRDPAAKLIPVVPSIDAHILALGGGSGSSLGTGGMATKLKAAQIVTEVGCQMVIANGSKPALLYDIVGGKPVGTRFLAKEK